MVLRVRYQCSDLRIMKKIGVFRQVAIEADACRIVRILFYLGESVLNLQRVQSYQRLSTVA
jgi:hypothetical protein